MALSCSLSLSIKPVTLFERVSHLLSVLPGSPVENWRHVEGRPSLLSLAPHRQSKSNASNIQFDKPKQSCNKGSSALRPAALAESTILLFSPGFPRLSKLLSYSEHVFPTCCNKLQRATCDKLSAKVCTNSDRCLKSHQRLLSIEAEICAHLKQILTFPGKS